MSTEQDRSDSAPTRKQLRQRIDELLSSNADLNRFVIDEFYSIKQKYFGDNFSRLQKINTLLEMVPPEDLNNALESYKIEANRAAVIKTDISMFRYIGRLLLDLKFKSKLEASITSFISVKIGIDIKIGEGSVLIIVVAPRISLNELVKAFADNKLTKLLDIKVLSLHLDDKRKYRYISIIALSVLFWITRILLIIGLIVPSLQLAPRSCSSHGCSPDSSRGSLAPDDAMPSTVDNYPDLSKIALQPAPPPAMADLSIKVPVPLILQLRPDMRSATSPVITRPDAASTWSLMDASITDQSTLPSQDAASDFALDQVPPNRQFDGKSADTEKDASTDSGTDAAPAVKPSSTKEATVPAGPVVSTQGEPAKDNYSDIIFTDNINEEPLEKNQGNTGHRCAIDVHGKTKFIDEYPLGIGCWNNSFNNRMCIVYHNGVPSLITDLFSPCQGNGERSCINEKNAKSICRRFKGEKFNEFKNLLINLNDRAGDNDKGLKSGGWCHLLPKNYYYSEKDRVGFCEFGRYAQIKNCTAKNKECQAKDRVCKYISENLDNQQRTEQRKRRVAQIDDSAGPILRCIYARDH